MTKRYEHHYDLSQDCHCRMEEAPDGEFVHYSDYKVLVTALQEAIRDLELDYPRSCKITLTQALLKAMEAV